VISSPPPTPVVLTVIAVAGMLGGCGASDEGATRDRLAVLAVVPDGGSAVLVAAEASSSDGTFSATVADEDGGIRLVRAYAEVPGGENRLANARLTCLRVTLPEGVRTEAVSGGPLRSEHPRQVAAHARRWLARADQQCVPVEADRP